MSSLAFVVACLMLLVIGQATLHGRRWRLGAGELAAAWGVGVAVAVPMTVAVGLLGWPISPLAFFLLLVFLAVGAWLLGKGRRGVREVWAPEPRWLRWVARVVLCLAAGVFLWKLWLAPVWSWDHFVMWGLKARRLAASGAMDFSFLAEPQLQRAKADTPVGVPVAWLLLSLGTVPGAATFKLAHAAFGFGLLAVVRAAAARLAGSLPVGELAAAFVALSPLLWDTTTLGLADLPLAFFATAAVAALLAALRTPERPDLRGLAVAGLLAGFLPWTKDEGLPLALLLTAVAAVWMVLPLRPALRSPRSGRLEGRGPAARLAPFAAFAVPVLAGIATMALVDLAALPEGERFLAGDWTARLAERLDTEGRAVLAAAGRELAAAEWLGFWLVFPPAAVLTLLPRRRRAPLPAWPLAAAVAAQLALYVFVILASYLPPLDQVGSGLFRIASALLPLGVLPVAALAARKAAGVEWAMATDSPASGPLGFIREFASKLRYPQLFFVTAGLFVLDLAVPDFVPFVDEILLGLLTVLLARLKERRPKDREPREKNVTPGR